MAATALGKTISFIITRDRAAARAFYCGVLGFTLTAEDDFATVLDLDGTMLRISTVENHVPQLHTVLGWEVADIVASARMLRDNGVVFNIYPGFGQDEFGIWPAPGGSAKVAWFKDPDGNVLSITQFQAGEMAIANSA